MIDEEKLAEEYANGRGHEHYHFLFEENNGCPADFAKLCYLDGLVDGRKEQWHDLRKDPKDIPNSMRNVWTNVGPSYYDIADHCWRDDFGRTQGVIAWCEPKFEE